MTRDDLILRNVTADDLPVFFEHQLDPEASRMAAFTVQDPADREAFLARWDRILADDSIVTKTIVAAGRVVGHVASFERFGRREVTYWLGREHWGRGLASRALRLFLDLDRRRPLHARAAKDNLASLRVLDKCGFEVVGEDKGFANARCGVVEELVLILRAR